MFVFDWPVRHAAGDRYYDERAGPVDMAIPQGIVPEAKHPRRYDGAGTRPVRYELTLALKQQAA
ncbi:MAG: hypothetical protein M1435_01335 [Actinobacteria bacterium]|nr:hypothetical protein [Actinomycetota bacterium]